MLSGDKFFYTFADREYYEPIDRYVPNEAAYKVHLDKHLPRDWSVVRQTIWYHCNPEGAQIPVQGWKIHLSATLDNDSAILTTVCRVLVHRRVPFKCAVDRRILYLLTSKRWARGGANKFITVYPNSREQFVELIEELYLATFGYHGAYILSDRRYKDSEVVYYRYGGLIPNSRLTVQGEQELVLQAPDGAVSPDTRNPFFSVPDWETDPFVPLQEPEQEEEAAPSLKNGRYIIKEPLQFSNMGGVYLATDTSTGADVLIKEARPYTNLLPGGIDGVSYLKKEHRLLSVLADAAIAPRPIDFFREWEHYYLVEEYIVATNFRSYTMERNIVLRTQFSKADVQQFYEYYIALFTKIAEGVEILHAHNIVFADLSPNNILVGESGAWIRFIDFEAAQEIGVDQPTLVYTPGFASTERAEGSVALFADDYYAFGSLLLSGLMTVSMLLHLDAHSSTRFLQSICADFGLPSMLSNIVSELTASPADKRVRPIDAMNRLLHASVRSTSGRGEKLESKAATEQLNAIAEYIVSSATPDRADRLFPCDTRAFSTNPLSLSYGACGVATVLRLVGHDTEGVIDSWIFDKPIDPSRYPPGLYMGISGVAWYALEAGRYDRGCELANMAVAHPLNEASPDIFFGSAGIGLTQLKCYLLTNDDTFLRQAARIGDALVANAENDSNGLHWPAFDHTYCGYAHGISGIVTYLLYLSVLTGDSRYLNAGERGLSFALDRKIVNKDGAWTWRLHEDSDTVTPYWRYGTAGVAAAILRYWHVTKEPRYHQALVCMEGDLNRKYAVFPASFFGLAGIGDCLLDFARFDPTRSAVHIARARRIAEGISLFALKRKEHIAFPGEQLMRITCDVGTGSAGILAFLHRLHQGGSNPFMLDSILQVLEGQQDAATEYQLRHQ